MADRGSNRLDLLLGATYLVVTVLVMEAVGGYAFHIVPAVRILFAIVTGAVLVVWGIVMIPHPPARPRTVLAAPLLVAVVTFAASVLASQRPRLSFEPAVLGIATALLFLMLTTLLRRPVIRRLTAVLIVLVPAFISVAYIVQVVVEWIRWWALVGRLAAPPLRPSFVDLSLGSPNLVATYLLIFTPLACAIAARRFGLRVSAVILALASVALVLTGSRSGYVGAAVALLVALLLERSVVISTTRAAIDRFGGGRGRLTLPVIGLVLAGLVIALGPGLASRLSLSGADYRSWFWRSAMELFAGSPIFGTGPGTWAQLKLATALPTEVNAVVPHAHNLLLQSLTEVGLVGIAGIAVLVAAIGWRARSAHRAVDRWTGVEIVAAIAGLGGLLGQQVTDYVMNIPAVMMAAIILVAWIDGADPSPPRSGAARRSTALAGPLAATLALILAATIPTLVSTGTAMLIADGANAASAKDDWGGALAGYDRAIANDPGFTLYRIERANALAHLGRLEDARAQYEAVVDVDLLPQNVMALAAVDLELGDQGRAASLARLALTRSWRDPTIGINAGRILELTGDRAGAIAAYAAAVRADLALVSSDYWRAPARTVSLEAVVDAARSIAVGEGDLAAAAVVSAYAGRIDDARADVAQIADPDARARYSAVLEAIAGDRAAGIAELRARVAARPNDFDALVWLTRLLGAAGDPSSDRYAQLARILRADEAGGQTIQDMSIVPATGQDRAYGAVPGYPFAVYSRRGPADLWPPQVLVIGPAGSP
ncbi:MAG TPA: O-antigen ligase family protein [Candidatus Limnocylindrales bacterium]